MAFFGVLITSIFIGLAIWGIVKNLPYIVGFVMALPQLLYMLVTWLPLTIYRSLKLAFTKGSRLYKWRFLVVFDIVAVVAIIAVVILD